MSETKPEVERIYTIPLAKAWIAPRYRRTRRVINMLKEYAEKHMKSSEIKIDTSLNEQLWNRGMSSPPRRITVKMIKDEDGVVTISLPKEEKISEEKEPSATPSPAEAPALTNSASGKDSSSEGTKPSTAQGQNTTAQTAAPVQTGSKKKASKQ